MAVVLSSLQLKTGLRAARATRVARWVAYLQIKAAGDSATYWPAVPIAASKGARLLQWSESTWRRAVIEAERLGWIQRTVRSGRVKGNRRGYNPGSLFQVVWSQLPGGRPALDGGPPLIIQAARTRVLNTKRIPQPGQPSDQPSQIGEVPNSEPSQVSRQPGHFFDLRTQSNLDPVLPRKGPDDGEVESRGQLGAPSALAVHLPPPARTSLSGPPPTPQGGPSAGEGVPCPPDIAAQAKSAPWYKGRSA